MARIAIGFRLLSEDDESRDELEMNRNAQYVISGTNAIVIYGSHRMTADVAP